MHCAPAPDLPEEEFNKSWPLSFPGKSRFCFDGVWTGNAGIFFWYLERQEPQQKVDPVEKDEVLKEEPIFYLENTVFVRVN